MKAVVIESKDRKSVILGSDGSFYTIRGSHRVGEEISYIPVKRYTMGAVSLVAAVMLFFSCFTIYDDNYRVYATVMVDGDAKIEYEINKKEEIIGIKAVDSDSEDIVEHLKKEKMDKKVHINEGIKRTKKLIAKKNGRKAKAKITVKAAVKGQKSWKRSVINDIEKQEKKDKNTVVTGASGSTTSGSKQNNSTPSVSDNTNTGNKDSGTVKTEDKEVKTEEKVVTEKNTPSSDSSQSKSGTTENGDKTSQDKGTGSSSDKKSDKSSENGSDKDSVTDSEKGSDKGSGDSSNNNTGTDSDKSSGTDSDGTSESSSETVSAGGAGKAPVDTGSTAANFQAAEDEAISTAIAE